MVDEGQAVTGVKGPTTTSAVRMHGALWTWLALGVVVALVGTLVLVKVVGGTTQPRTVVALTQTSAAVLDEVTSIPPAVYNEVGVSSSTVPIAAPKVLSGVRPLVFTGATGARLPGVVFWGAEFCSFCAAERWPLIAALSRFGTFGTLYNMESSATDYAPSTPTFTFYSSEYKSRLVVFRPYEVQSDVPGTVGYLALMAVPPRERDAKAICASCAVGPECLQCALRIREAHGIWGGTTELERRAISERQAS